MSKIPNILVSASYRVSGEVVLHMHNMGCDAKMISQKAVLAGIILCHAMELSWDTSVRDQKRLDVSMMRVEDWKVKFPKVFEPNVQYGEGDGFGSLKVSAREIDWKVPIEEIPLKK